MSGRRILVAGAGLALTVALCGPATHAGPPAPIIGAMGDSLTDEYAEGDYDYALNWVQQLAIFRGVNFGPTALDAGQAGGTWGEPRRSGYRHNWARSGADSVTLLSDGQHTGLASDIEQFGVTHAVLAIGANDFAPIPLPGYAYFNIYWNLWSNAQRQNYINNVASRIATAMDTVLAAPGDVHFVLANVPDYGVTPIARQFFTNASRRQNVTVVINQLNTIIASMAAEREIVLLDISGLATAIFGTNHNLDPVLLIGDVPIFLWESDTQSNSNPDAGFVHDSIHPHTTLQGVFANLIAEGLNVGYGTGIPLFNEAAILEHAGLEYGGAETLPNEIGPLAAYIVDFTPKDEPAAPGDLNVDGVVDVLDMLLLFAAWGECPKSSCPADLNGDGVVDVLDMLILFANWG